MVEFFGDPFEELFKSILYFERLPRASDVRDVVERLTSEDYPRYFKLLGEYGIHQFWNQEYIGCLAGEVKKRVGDELVLEVAAGDGMLSFWLRNYGVNIRATDSGAWYNYIKRRAPVEIIDAVSAIRKYKPRMVVASWLPAGESLDIEIFNTCAELNIPYIILIGEEDGACGSPTFWDEKYWKKVGYKHDYLDCDEYNWCRTDWYDPVLGWFRHSRTGIYTKIMKLYEKCIMP
jgi:hypothetical protein